MRRNLTSPVLSAVLASAVMPSVAATTVQAAYGRAPVGTFTGCPRHVRSLPRESVQYERSVRRVVLRFVRTGFLKYAQTPAEELRGARVRRILPVKDWRPSGWIKIECGLVVWERSLAALVYFPRLDRPHNPAGHCNDCARLTFLLARTRSGWTVWGRY